MALSPYTSWFDPSWSSQVCMYTCTTKCIGDPWGGKSAIPTPNPMSTGMQQGTANKQRYYIDFSTGSMVNDDEQTHMYPLFIADFLFPDVNDNPPVHCKRFSSPVVVVRCDRHAWQRLLALEGPFLAPWVLSAGCRPCAVSSWSAGY